MQLAFLSSDFFAHSDIINLDEILPEAAAEEVRRSYHLYRLLFVHAASQKLKQFMALQLAQAMKAHVTAAKQRFRFE